MSMRSALTLSSFCLLMGISHAENVNLNEKPETTSVYLTPYAVGPGVGVISAMNRKMLDQSTAFLKVSLAQTWRFQEHWDAGFDIDVWFPASNYGGFLNLDYVFGAGGFRPFLGAGVGMQYVDDPSYNNFGKGLGAAAQVMVGAYIDVTEGMHLRIRAPFEIVGNSGKDAGAGIDAALLFSFPQYNPTVKKLKY